MVCFKLRKLNIWHYARSAFKPLPVKALRGYDRGFTEIWGNEEKLGEGSMERLEAGFSPSRSYWIDV